METTLEVRWFVRGVPPAVVQRWFRLECPGKLLEKLDTRKDWYACQQKTFVDKIGRFSSRALNRDEVNFKLRQGNPELKLRQQEFGTYGFGHQKRSPSLDAAQSFICEGKVEQWCKFGEQELKDPTFTAYDLLSETEWIGIDKERRQKIEQGVASELTCLKINNEPWWSIAFELTQNNDDRQQDACFKEVVERACQTYCGPKLSATNSYGYSRWLLEFETYINLSSG
ncbi:hypothetical protein [Pleurocapsa sp. FMAR1]|uniref:hypothetical protein n=1 Tax=Pleurocapsa sp. FMAR1 TaxID=3040204 RepID=UPI0029C6F48B|nr:hypothetical protein [Pleurocapsa sp. FMAR1]